MSDSVFLHELCIKVTLKPLIFIVHVKILIGEAVKETNDRIIRTILKLSGQ